MNNKIFAKEIVRVITLLLSGFAIAYFALCFMVPQFNSNSSSPDKSEKMIVHQFDQDILLEYHTLHNGRTETIVNLFLSEKENAAASYVLPGEFVKPEINLIYHEDGLECYEWLSKSTCVITYKYEDSKVKAYPPIIPNDSDYNLLYPTLKQEFMTKDWRRIQAFGEVLLKNKDFDVRAILERYASGSFTTEEIDQNEKSNSVTPNQIQTFSDSLLLKYK